jgi:hypothetical protein
MKRTRRHNRAVLIPRIVCLVTVAVMLAGPALAALPALIDCGGACGCCPTADRQTSPTIRKARSVAGDCCQPGGEIACRMAAENRPTALMAAHRQLGAPSPDSGQTIASGRRPVAAPPVSDLPFAWLRQGPRLDPSPIYLTTCRLIC